MRLSYEKEDIELCLNLLNSLVISGLGNAEKLAVIGDKLKSYTVIDEEDKDGECSKEK